MEQYEHMDDLSDENVAHYGSGLVVDNAKLGSERPLMTTDLFAQAREHVDSIESYILGSQKELSDTASEVTWDDSDVESYPFSLSRPGTGQGQPTIPQHNSEATEKDLWKFGAVQVNRRLLPIAQSSDSSIRQQRGKIEPFAVSDLSVAPSKKRSSDSKLAVQRFICCFQSGPGQKCSGTDETISEVIKSLSHFHDTHICDRCWTLKSRNEHDALVHGVTCDDYCLSPKCRDAIPTIGDRHKFRQNTCGRRTSRVGPQDREAVFRFIFRLVHPTIDMPDTVFAHQRTSHMNETARQFRRRLRKPSREELTAMLDNLAAKLDESHASSVQIRELERRLALAGTNIRDLERQNGEIIALLSDALRTGTFHDQHSHNSLLRRVDRAAPSALEPLSQRQTAQQSHRSKFEDAETDFINIIGKVPENSSHNRYAAGKGQNVQYNAHEIHAITGHDTKFDLADPTTSPLDEILNLKTSEEERVEAVSDVLLPDPSDRSWARAGTSRMSSAPDIVPERASVPCFAQVQADLERLEDSVKRIRRDYDHDNASISDTDSTVSDCSPNHHSCLGDERRSSSNTQCTPSDSTTGSNNGRTAPSTSSSSNDTGTPARSDQGPSRKRRRTGKNNDAQPKTAITPPKAVPGPDPQHTFCFLKHGPYKKCAGTDQTIEESLTNLERMHDTFICGNCWELDEKREKHLSCVQHCIAGTCNFTGTEGKHPYDLETCGPEPGRNLPGDRWPTYNFLYKLLHSKLPDRDDIFTHERTAHWGAPTRSGKRKIEKLIEELENTKSKLAEATKTHEDERKLDQRNAMEEVERTKSRLVEAAKMHEKERETDQTKIELWQVKYQSELEKNAGREETRTRVEHILHDLLQMVWMLLGRQGGQAASYKSYKRLLLRVSKDAGGALRPPVQIEPYWEVSVNNSVCVPHFKNVVTDGQGQTFPGNGAVPTSTVANLANGSLVTNSVPPYPMALSTHGMNHNPNAPISGLDSGRGSSVESRDGTSSAQSGYATRNIDSRRTATIQGSVTRAGGAVSIDSDQVGTNHQRIIENAARSQGGNSAHSADLQGFDFPNVDLNNLSDEDFQEVLSTFLSDSMLDTHESSTTYNQ